MNAFDLAEAFRFAPRVDTVGSRAADSAASGTRDLSIPDWMTTGCADPGADRRRQDGR
ncbi:hypothetical protein [Streptomyces sp. NPDC057939]|uniref:hypothetical protein n=1 Tax=Streptomyces sp. NPDC057939 TaxID=3346284 RepID=UPI0036E00899